MFNHNIKIMNNIRNYRSSIIQLLVHNYLTHEYKTQNVFIYPELINDLDIFSTNLSIIDVLSIDGKLNTNIDIQAILDVTSDEYVQSCEIKSGNICGESTKIHLFDFSNLLQLMTKINYPTETKLLLILVPNTYEFQTEKLLDINMFEKLKLMILSESDENRRKMFNILVNEKSFRSRDINSVLTSIIGMTKKQLLDVYIDKLKNRKDIYEELSDNNYNYIIQNFGKIELKILRLEELEKYPLSGDIIKSLLSLY